MATYSIKWLRNFFGTKFFPITHITAVRDNNNVNLETLLNNKADQATTLAGYGITDAYTKTESNGQFFGLTNGTELGASSSNAVNLDNITTQGTYYNRTSSNAQYISNRPNTNNEIFRLWVYDCGGSTIIQRYRANSMAITYERMGLSSWGGMFTWGNWVLVQEDLSHYALSEGSSSDARLKDKVDDINLNVEDIAKAPNLTFKWKDRKDNNLHGGTYAQYWENITPYYVHGSDSKTLEYGNLALTCSIELAKEMTKLKEENVQLKKELEDIKETLNKLNK